LRIPLKYNGHREDYDEAVIEFDEGNALGFYFYTYSNSIWFRIVKLYIFINFKFTGR